MYVHIAIFRWKDGISSDQINTALRTVKSLKSLVPGVTDICVGANYSRWNKGFTHAVVVIGKSQEAIDKYRAHPIHSQIAAEIENIEADGIGIDFHDDDEA